MKKLNTTFVFLIVYYLLLFVLETPILFSIGVPSTLFRIAYFVLLFIPLWVYEKSYLPLVILASYSISKFGTSVTFMPTDIGFYVPIFMLIAYSIRKSESKHWPIPSPLFILFFGVLFVDLLTTFNIHDVFVCLFILLTLFFCCSNNNINSLHIQLSSHVFIVISIILALELIFANDQYIESYGYTDMDRVHWADPNYLGSVIGMGGMAAGVLLYRNYSLLSKYYLFVALSLVITALVINASRGAILALVCGILIMFNGRGLKLWQKIIVFGLTAAVIIVLYTNNYFELLEYRIENDTGGGSGRTEIWLRKWSAYINNSSIRQLLFGMGYENGYKAGFTYNRAFHNDFLAFLVDYGFVGLVTFVCLFFYPLKNDIFRNKAVLGCVIYLLVVCMTLEPFCLGVLIFYYFWFYIYSLAKISGKQYNR